MSDDRMCPVCGETAPEPASLCLRRIARLAVQGEPCDYSIEGEARFAAEIGDERADRINAVLSAPTPALNREEADRHG